jgi:hypothetical protein
MLADCIIVESPLYSCYCCIGRQCSMPGTGGRRKRVLHGVINVRTGDVLLLITKVWDEVTHQYFRFRPCGRKNS